MKKGEGIKKYQLVVTKHGDIKCRIENIGNNIIITVCGARWVLDLLGGITL